MIVADSSVWIDYFNGVRAAETDRLDKLLATELVLVGDLILAEVLQGFVAERDFRRARSLLATLPCADMAGRNIALAAAANYRRMRTGGITVRKTIDVLIATFCIRNGHTLLHRDRDRDFDAMERALGLAVLH